MQDVIPEVVFAEIQGHLRERTTHAEQGWEAGSDEEDTLTGDLCGSLRTPGWVRVQSDGQSWEWRISYKKFRGRGRGAAEKQIGADGIVQVEVRPGLANEIVHKGLLFQAKKIAGSSRREMHRQVEGMESVAPGGSAVFEYGPRGYRAASGQEILRPETRDVIRIGRPNLSDYLSDRFLPCTAGLRGMYYDAVRGNLIVPGSDGPHTYKVSLRHRVLIEVERA